MATLTLMSGTMLRPTPPMGWNSYDSYGASIMQSEVIAQAQALKTTLQPFGWNTVVIDYRWYDPEDTLDSNGRYLPSISKYPSATGRTGSRRSPIRSTRSVSASESTSCAASRARP